MHLKSLLAVVFAFATAATAVSKDRCNCRCTSVPINNAKDCTKDNICPDGQACRFEIPNYSQRKVCKWTCDSSKPVSNKRCDCRCEPIPISNARDCTEDNACPEGQTCRFEIPNYSQRKVCKWTCQVSRTTS
ncbi:hypothetical protein X797_010882 [Metarhizium robertsii]|uniref:Uncharacterized protein n=2 Tax=Metarhizium robertsii TaxID=568076 RepID=A0A0B2XDI5_METRA|nr:uncharacterized protein MAA_11571 [Metarhizium robertsii ARSEF 23]EXU96071.1 hypothetical protein X797_010882 [Metarhizium robertsii]KHO10810.1 hypothetical protein MAA_11571 [Metarhizium robertsii ARSEF 23]